MAKVRAALIALTCAGALLSSAETVSFQGHTISYAGASATNWVANATTGGHDFVLVFSNTTATGSFTLPSDAFLTSSRILAVGGGGAGASGAKYSTSNAQKNNGGNGGGGGGGVTASDDSYFAADTTYTVTVGAGGAVATSASTATVGNNGKTSFISYYDGDEGVDVAVITALGGGGGGAQSAGADGANGGGGSRKSQRKSGTQYTGVNMVGGSATSESGFAGGAGNKAQFGGGGGGAGAAGADASDGGAGGAGVASDITGESIVYGGGGGGGYVGSAENEAQAEGGAGGGGSGGVATFGIAGNVRASSGEDGLGGGGGGGGSYNASYADYALGGAGGDGIVIVRFTAVYAKPEKPTESVEFTYDGEIKTALAENPSYTISGTYQATDAGTYTATVALKPALVAQGLTWTDGTTNDVVVTMTIAQAANKISNLTLESWISGQLPNAPSATAKFGAPSYSWSDAEDGDFIPYSTVVSATSKNYPDAVGKYYLKATVEETTNYEGAEAILAFYVWASPKSAYDDYVEITISGLTESETLVNFPVLIRLSESTVHGFLYSRAGATGENIVFTSEDDSVRYPHEIDVWDTTGESRVWVRVSQLKPTTTIKMRWSAKDGAATPAYAPETVWSEYLGVWHFAGTTKASIFKDSTGHGLTASLASGASCKAEAASRIGSAIRVTGGNLVAPDYAARLNDAAKFSFYEWVSAPGYATAKDINVRFCGKTTGDETPAGALKDGWAIELNSGKTANWQWSGGETSATLDQNLTQVNGAMLGLVSGDGQNNLVRYRMFTQPTQFDVVTDDAYQVVPNGENLRLAADGFAIDEARLAAKPFSQTWMKAEYLTVDHPESVTFGVVDREGKKIDWWTTEASISKTTWRVGEDAGVLTEPVASSGHAVTAVISNLMTSATCEASEMPAEPGCYRVIYQVAEEDGYAAMEATVDFQIVGQAATYDDLIGDAATLTLSGRVLLANDDSVDGHAVTDQGYWQKRKVTYRQGGKQKTATYATFWEHTGSITSSVGTCRAGYDHNLSHIDDDSSTTNVIWRLRDVIIGSPYDSSGSLSSYCALPYSSTSMKISSYNNKTTAVGTDAYEAGMMMMRNKIGAAVYSPCYTNGIGTIYFDAVNLNAAEDSDDYALVVEVATTTAEGKTPTDENCYNETANVPEFGNLEDVSGSCWQTNLVLVLKKDGTEEFVPEGLTNRVALSVKTGGSDANFYRLAVPVNCRDACRFRIRRVSRNVEKTDPDAGNFIVLDNIIVSPPKMTADVVPYGTFDNTRADGLVPGYVGAMDVAFPAIGESVSGRARIETWTNGSSAGSDPSKFITLSRLNYRWRYLDQQVGAWQSSMLAATADGDLKSIEPMNLPAQEGDVEFWFESYLSVPYYEYFDYTGKGYGLKGADGETLYTESEGDIQTNRYVLAMNETLASYGRDWYFRLRPTKSQYERWRVLACTNLTAGVVTTNEMALTTSGAWRGFVKTLEAPSDGKIKFRFEGLNPQTDGATDYAYSTNAWQAASLGETPNDAAVTAGSDWATAPCDASTGYLLFQLTEPTSAAAGKVLVARADKQDFNLWSSGVTSNGLYTGSSDNTNSTSLATQTYALDFASLSPSVATNAAWTETFYLGSGVVARAIYPRNVPFTSAKVNGWSAENAMWICKKWANESAAGFGDETALQLQGRGRGTFTFADASTKPNGLDYVRFRARVAQYNEFDNFTYYDGLVGSSLARNQKRYTFVTKLALTCDGERSFDGDGSVSLVAAYHPQYGCYELRFSRCMTNTILRAELFKWTPSSDGATRATSLGSANLGANTTTNLVHDAGAYGAAFIAIEPGTDGTKVFGGLYTGAGSLPSEFNWPADIDGKQFAVLSYYDTQEPLTKGTYGVLARNCPGEFRSPCAYSEPFVIKDVTDQSETNMKKDELVFSSGKTVTIPSTVASTATQLNVLDDWIVKSGRTLPKLNSGTGALLGFNASTNITQKLILQLSPTGAKTWTDFCTNDITGFVSEWIDVPVRKGTTYDVRFKAGGTDDGVRTDVVITDVQLAQWAGQTTRGYQYDAATGYSDKFVYLQSWIVEDANSNRVIRLQPARASSASAPMGVRTPAMEGLGLVGFKWRNADTNAVLHVQYVTRDTLRLLKNNLKSLSDAPSDNLNWTTLETIKFADLTADECDEGARTINVNVRAPQAGVIRLVVDRDVVTTAMKPSVMNENPLYGSVEIAEFFAWDLPAYDKRSWTGWNFRTAGWDNYEAGPYANLRDYPTGLSGLLNNTLDESTLENGIKDYYRQRPPSVQSPTFMTNCVGVVEFKARLYGTNDVADAKHPAAVTVYGADVIDANGEPTHWKDVGDVIVSNVVYTTYTMKLRNSENFYALRLGVKGVEGVDGAETPVYANPLRVAIDDVCLWEKAPLSVAFRKDHVRPFRNARKLKTTDVVEDVDDVEEQPILEETFGFQAEVEVRDASEIVLDDPSHPVSVTLWYYPGAEPWGYDNWKTNANARRVVLDAADGTNLIFRSTRTRSDSFCPPQTLEAGEDYRVVQYQMVATFYDKSGEKFEQPMSSSEWAMPSWDTGFDDPNAKDGAAFSAFTVLETIAPKRAWINEINLVEYDGGRDRSKYNQWIELAIPTGVNMMNWTVNVYDYDGAKAVTLVKLGKNCPGAKSLDPVNHYEFYVAKGPQTTLEGADATWSSTLTSASRSIVAGAFSSSQAYGLELVRPSGIVEHRAVVQGYNIWKEMGYPEGIWLTYEGTNITAVLNEKPTGGWVWTAEDFKAYPGCTVGVTNDQGQVHEDWCSPMGKTPGEINENQVIDPDWFTRPNGGFRWIDAVVSGLHLRQIVGDETNTTVSISVEDGKSTNFVYEVDRWYRLGAPAVVPAETTSTTLSGPVTKGRKSYYTLTINSLTNDVRITAQAAVAEELEDYLEDVGAYKPAILNWLESGDFEGDTIQLGKYRGATGADAETQDLTLLVHYWLDLDPTCGGWELWGGMGEKGGGDALGPVNNAVIRVNAANSALVHTNVQTTVWLMITNTTTGVAYPPRRLQGLGNEQSDLFAGNWTSATFKVEMQLYKDAWRGRFRAMRYFVFGPNSFRPADDPDAPFAARIEITDPFSRQSPAWEWGWYRYAEEGMAPWTRWNLNEEITPGGVSTLKADDTLTY